MCKAAPQLLVGLGCRWRWHSWEAAGKVKLEIRPRLEDTGVGRRYIAQGRAGNIQLGVVVWAAPALSPAGTARTVTRHLSCKCNLRTLIGTYTRGVTSK